MSLCECVCKPDGWDPKQKQNHIISQLPFGG